MFCVPGVVLAVLAFAPQSVPRGNQPLHPKLSDIDWTRSNPAAAGASRRPASEAVLKKRYDHAWDLVRAGDYDGALEDFAWLWDETDKGDGSDMEVAAVRDALLKSIARVAPCHEPTRVRFTAILDELETFVRKDQPPSTYREWIDWETLSRALKQEDRLIRLYEERRQPDGSIDTDALQFYAWDATFEVLVERGRFADAGRYDTNIVERVESRLTITDELIEDDPDYFSRSDIEQYRREERSDVALLHAVGLAAGRIDESARVAAALLAKYDDIESRRALVLACVRVGVTSDAVPRWISEMEAKGADVSDLKVALMDAAQK